MQIIKAVHLANLDPAFREYYVDGQNRVWSKRGGKPGYLLSQFNVNNYPYVALGGKPKSVATLTKFARENWHLAQDVTIPPSEDAQKDRHLARQHMIAMVDDVTNEMVIVQRNLTQDEARDLALENASNGGTMAVLKVEGICRMEKRAAWV